MIQDTICAPATIPGTGAISIIRISGQETFSIVDRVVSFKNGTAASASGYSLKFGTVRFGSGEVLDDVLVAIFRTPNSYTGENSAEIYCHASSFIVERILERLMESGAVMATAGEFSQRAFLGGKMDLTQAEAVADLISSNDEASHKVAMNHLKGGFSSDLKKMREQMLKLVSLMELELDFSEEDVEFADRNELTELLDKLIGHISLLIRSFRYGNAIKNGVQTAIIGETNTGKSTLLNALLGEDRAIVSDIAGTTRDTVEECMVVDGIKFRFIDTAGIRQAEETIEKIGISRSIDKLKKADIVLSVLDATKPIEYLLENARSITSMTTDGQIIVYLLNKADSISSNTIITYINLIVKEFDNKLNVPSTLSKTTTFAISAKNGQGIDVLKSALSSIWSSTSSISQDSVMVTNLRHLNALKQSLQPLERAKNSIREGIPTDLVAQDIREALYHIGTITGEITADEVLGEIFKGFCIGK